MSVRQIVPGSVHTPKSKENKLRGRAFRSVNKN